MKKIILTGVLALVCAPTFAQNTLYDGNYRCDVGAIGTLIGTGIKKVLTAYKVDWVQAIYSEEAATKSSPISGFVKHGEDARSFTVQKHPFGNPANETEEIRQARELAEQRIQEMKNLIKEHPAIRFYTLVVPNARDVANLTEEQFTFVKNFLLQPIYKEEFDAAYAPVVTHPTENAPETQLTFNNVASKRLFFVFACVADYKMGGRVVYFFADHIPPASNQ